MSNAFVVLPLRASDGSIKAWTKVDADDAPYLSQWSWCLHTNGYVYRLESVDGRKHSLRLHRLIVGLKRGDKHEVDHINRDRLDNRRANLRIVTNAQNKQNVPARGGSSKHRGVSRHGNGWVASYYPVYIGYFKTEEEAAEAASKWRAENAPFSEDARQKEAVCA